MSRKFWQQSDVAPPFERPECRAPRDLFGGSAPSGTVQTNTIQNSDPWSGVQPYLQDIFSRGQGLANRGTYGGPMLASQSPYTMQAQQMQAQRAIAPQNPLYGQAQDQITSTMRGDYLSADSNPYLQGAVQQALDQVKMNVNKQFSGDNYGSSGNQEWLAKSMANAALPIYAQNYQTERGRQLGATQMAPQLAGQMTAQDYASIDRLGAVGAAQDARSQAEIAAQQQQFDAPWQNLNRYQQAVAGGLAAGGSSSSSGQQPYYSNPMASALGMGVGGLQLYNGLSTAGLLSSPMTFGPAAAGFGASLFGGLGPVGMMVI